MDLMFKTLENHPPTQWCFFFSIAMFDSRDPAAEIESQLEGPVKPCFFTATSEQDLYIMYHLVICYIAMECHGKIHHFK